MTVLLSHLFLALASVLQPEPPATDTKLTDGFYRGAGFMLAVFVRVSGDTAFV